MTALAIVLIVVGVLIVLLLIGGLIAARGRAAANALPYAEHLAAADQALEQARAADRGWDREVLERVAAAAIEQAKPGWAYENLHLVLVDDRPGVAEDRAHLEALKGSDRVRAVLARGADGNWTVESVA